MNLMNVGHVCFNWKGMVNKIRMYFVLFIFFLISLQVCVLVKCTHSISGQIGLETSCFFNITHGNDNKHIKGGNVSITLFL